MSTRGTGELTRILRELFDRNNRMGRRTQHSTTVRIRDLPERPQTADRVLFDDTQPPASPKWAGAASWSRSSDNIRWSEGAKWL